MSKRCTCFTFLIVLLALAQGGAAYGAYNPFDDPALVGWWSFEEGSGTTAADSSSYGRAGTLTGGVTWTTGRFGGGVQLDGTSGYVTVPSFPLTTDSITMVAWVNGWKGSDWAAIITGQPTRLELGFGDNNTLHYTWNGDSSTTWSWTGGPVIPQDSWAMVAVTIDPAKAIAYVYTDSTGLSSGTNAIAHISQTFTVLSMGWSFDARYVRGILDEVAVFSRALTEEEILVLTKGPRDPALASAPTPADGADDVPRDTSLTWMPGEAATNHDIYFGTSFDDVNDATQPNQSQAETTYAPEELLEFGQTYFWRVDETADGTVTKGGVWSFTAEPFGYPIANVIATSTSTSQSGMGPENTVNGSGLNEYDEHGTDLKTMWVATGSMPHEIQYAFDNAYKLDEMWVWNANSQLESVMGFGARTVTVEYSTDGETWTALEGAPEFAQGTGEPTYTAGTVVDFGGVMAKYVKLTVTANWGGVTPQASLSEVWFLYVPVRAFYPEPADAATGVSINAELNWRPGREATSHAVYIGADANAVAEGTVAAEAVTDHRCTPPTMDLASVYYWRVDEVGDAGTYAGDVWSFTTQAFLVVDDFESYNDDMEAETTIWNTWTDGVTTEASGSQVGYIDAPFAETNIVHGGKQSMPLMYNNTSYAFSEAERTFSPAQDWTASGIKTLSVYFYGTEGNTGQLYLKIGNTKIAYDGEAADIAKAQWQQWLVDLSSISGIKSVKTLIIGVEGSGSTGTLYIDDICLYPDEIELITPVQPDTAGLLLQYKLDDGSGTKTADSSGNNNAGTITGTARWVPGVSGTGLEFDGATNFVGTGKSLLNDLPAFTIACWVKGDLSLGNRSGLIGQNDCVEYGVVSSNTVQIYTAGGGTVDLVWPYTSTDQWHHIAAVGDGSSIVFYLDGKAAVSGGTATESYGTSTFFVNVGGGGIFDATENYFTGQIDEIYVYQRALSPAEIAGLAGRTAPIPKLQ